MDYVTGFEPLNAAEAQLVQACVAGEECWLGDGARPEADDTSRRIRAALLRFLITGGNDGCKTADAGVRLVGAYVTGTLNLDFATARGQTLLGNCRFAKPVSAMQTRFESLGLGGSALPGLMAQGAKAAGGVFLRSSPDDRTHFHATGEVNLAGAEIGGQLSCKGGRFKNGGACALNAQGVRVTGDLILSDGFHATGAVRLVGAEISGQLSCIAGRFDNAKGDALNAQGVRVTRDVFLSGGFHASGEVRLSGAEIGGQLACSGGRFENAEGYALIAERLKVNDSFIWREVSVENGTVTLAAAHVGDLVDDLASWPEGAGRLFLDGFTYDRISGAFTDAPQRLKWLAGGTVWNDEFYPQPYTQLAKVLREMGHDRAARDVLVEQGRLIRLYNRKRALAPSATAKDHPIRARVLLMGQVILYPFRWLWDLLQRWVIGYGYRPVRAFIALFVLFSAATYVADAAWQEGSFAPNSDVILVSEGWTRLAHATANPAETWSAEGAPGMDWDSFNRYGYGADLVIPILNLGQTDAWAPSKDRGPWGWRLWWGRWVLTMLGWVVSALGLAAITGIIRRE